MNTIYEDLGITEEKLNEYARAIYDAWKSTDVFTKFAEEVERSGIPYRVAVVLAVKLGIAVGRIKAIEDVMISADSQLRELLKNVADDQ